MGNVTTTNANSMAAEVGWQGNDYEQGEVCNVDGSSIEGVNGVPPFDEETPKFDTELASSAEHHNVF